MKFINLLACLLLSVCAQAGHMLGGLIEYRTLANDSVEVTVKLYRDCTGVKPDTNSISLSVSTISPYWGTSYTIPFVSQSSVSTQCPSTPAGCAGTSLLRVELYVYRGNISLSSAPANACNFYFYYAQCCRNLTTNVYRTNTNFTSEYNRCTSRNSNHSVKRGLNPEFILEGYKTYRLSLSLTDSVDSDSISYELDHPYWGLNLQDTFNSPYTPTAPFSGSGFMFNQQTGEWQLRAFPSQLVSFFYRATEWRKDSTGTYVKVGSVYVDNMLFITSSSPNNNPQITLNGNNLNANVNRVNMCAGSYQCITLKATDPDTTTGDTTFFTLLHQTAPSGSFITNNTSTIQVAKTGTASYCWTPSLNHVNQKPYVLQVMARDKRCPQQGFSYCSIQVGVIGPVDSSRTITHIKNYEYSFSTPAQPGYAIEWMLSRNPNGTFDPLNTVTFKNRQALFNYGKSGTYVCRRKYSTETCTKIFFDTIVTSCKIDAVLNNDTTMCQRQLLFSVQASINKTWKTLSWLMKTLTDSSYTQLTDTLPQVNLSLAKGGFYTYVINVTDSTNCESVDTIRINVNHLISNLTDTMLCTDTVKTITLSSTVQSTSPHLYYQWYKLVNSSAVLLSGDTLPFLVSSRKTSGKNTYVIRVNDLMGCTSFDTVSVTLNPYPYYTLPANYTVCGDSVAVTATLTGNAHPVYYLWKGNDTNATIYAKTPGWVSLQLEHKRCVVKDSTFIQTLTLPNADAGIDKYICENSSVTLTPVTPVPAASWFRLPDMFPLMGTGVNAQAKPSQTTNYLLRASSLTANNRCFSYDTVKVFTGNPATIGLPNIRSYCSNEVELFLNGATPANGNGGMGWWQMNSPCFTSDTNKFDIACSGSGSFVATYYFKTNLFNCVSNDSLQIIIVQNPAASFISSADSGSVPLIIGFANTSTGNPTSFLWNFGDPSSASADTSTLANPQHTYNTPGFYRVKLSVTKVDSGATCKDSVSGTLLQAINTKVSLLNKPAPKVYPVPFSNKINIETADPIVSVLLFDYTGKKVAEQNNINHLTAEIDTRFLPEGFYLLQVFTAGKVQTIKLTKRN